MFLIGNIQNWLKPILIEYGSPAWMYDSFGLYAILFVAAGLLNTYFVQAVKPKSGDEKELLALRKKCKVNERTNKKETQKAVTDCTDLHKLEIKKIREGYHNELRLKTEDYNKKIGEYSSKIKAKDVLIESMTNQLAEKFQIIDEYNKETSSNRNSPVKTSESEKAGSIVPNISEYS